MNQAPPEGTSSIALRARRVLDRARGRGERFVPPRRLRGAGEDAYLWAGAARMRLLVGLAKLRPDDRVVEIGSGTGAIARPLADYLGPGGTYDGFDADLRLVAWAEKAYRDRPDFRFAALPDDGRLPLADESYDLVIAVGPLTRGAPEDAVRLLGEARRLLVPDGRLLATAFLLDAEARGALEAGTAEVAFGPSDGRYAAAEGGAPVALEEEWLLDRVAEAGFVRAGIRHGTWTPREGGRSHEDVLVARR